MLTIFRLVNLRRFFAHRLRSSLSVLGVALGVALIFSISTLNESITGSFVELLETIAGKAVIEVSGPSSSGFDEGLLVDVVKVEGIKDAVPMVKGYTTLVGNAVEEKVLLLGVPPDVSKILPDYASEQTTLLNSRVYKGVLLGQELANALQIELEDQIELLTPGGIQSFTLIGLLPDTELERISQGNLAIMKLPVAQDALGRDGMYDSIYITLKEGFDVDKTIEKLQAALGDKVIVGQPSFRGKNIEGMWRSLQDTLSVVSIVALFVGMFLIYNTMSVAALERRREMGLLRALGLMQKEAFRPFMIEAGLIGVGGAIIGVLLGVLIARPLVAMTASFIASSYPFQTAGVHISPSSLPVCLFAGLISSLAATYFPARGILTVSPTESLRPRGVLETTHDRRSSSLVVGIGLAGIGVVALLCYLFLISRIYLLGFALFSIFLGTSLMIPRIVNDCIRPIRGIFSAWGRTTGRLASDNLAKFSGRTSVTVGALMISLAMVVAIGGTTGSFAAAVREAMDSVFGANLYVRSRTWRFSGSDVPLDFDFGRELEKIEGVSLVAPLRDILCDWQDQQLIIIAIEPQKQSEVQDLILEAGSQEEALGELGKGDRAMVSSYLADRFGLKVGEHIELKSPTGLHKFKIVAVFTAYSLGQGVVNLSREDLVKYWGDRAIDQFAIKLEEGASAYEVKEEIMRRYSERKQLTVMTREERSTEATGLADNFLSLFDGLKAVATLVAGLGILNTILISVLGRRREFGILRALGMVRKQLVEMVLYEAFAVGLIGGGLGVVLGSLLSPFMVQAVQPATGFRVDYVFPYQPIVSACFIAILVSLLAAYYPARRAAATDIVQALRYE